MLSYLGPMLPHVGPIWSYATHILGIWSAYVDPFWTMSGLCWPILDHVGHTLGLCWSILIHVGLVLGHCLAYMTILGNCETNGRTHVFWLKMRLCWLHIRSVKSLLIYFATRCSHVKPMLTQVGPHLKLSYAYSGPMLTHSGLCWAYVGLFWAVWRWLLEPEKRKKKHTLFR